jgi:hypothetical protein
MDTSSSVDFGSNNQLQNQLTAPAMARPLPYRELIKNPRSVCDDWFYRVMSYLPGHPALWAILLGLGLPIITTMLSGIGEPISYPRTLSDLKGTYFFAPLMVIQVLAMPILYQSAVGCFDQLRRAMTTSDAQTAAIRQTLVEPNAAFQAKFLVFSILMSLLVQQASSLRITRFFTGDWNAYDVWLTFAGSVNFTMFLWYLIIPISRTLKLADLIGQYVKPALFDDGLGPPISTFGLRAGLIFAIPYAIVVSSAAAMLDLPWTYLLPGVVGTLAAMAYAYIPGQKLSQRIHQVKQAELDRVNTLINRSHSIQLEDDIDNTNTDKFLRLVEYRREVKAIREWPFEARFVRAFGLYFLLIPLTWVASALVEILIDRLSVF